MRRRISMTNETIIEYINKYKKPLIIEGRNKIKFPQYNDPLEIFTFEEEEIEIINLLFAGNDQKFVYQELFDFSNCRNRTRKELLLEDCKKIEEIAGDEVTNDFIEKNKKRLLIDRNTKFAFKYLWYEEQALVNKENFSGYPSLELSRIGFNKERTKCILCYGYMAGGLAGDGGFIIMEKKKELWVSKKNKARYVGLWRS
jgi:hypothetical protein